MAKSDNSEDGLDVVLTMTVADCDPRCRQWLPRQLKKLAHIANLRGEISLLICGDKRMARLHEEWTQVSGTTDCLSFDWLEGEERGKGQVEGELILCMDVARRQARRRGHTVREELLLYALHGLMHLDGEDDLDHDSYVRMHAREDRLLKSAGFPALFYGSEGEAL